jgi:gamma-glutamyltranspeptidase
MGGDMQPQGHVQVLVNLIDFGGYQGILIDWEKGVLHGATEPRKHGVAAGY